MPSEQELIQAATRLHGHLLARHHAGGLVHGPDAGVRFHLRLWRFLKAGFPQVRWNDDYIFMQTQGYWIISNWMLSRLTHEPLYRSLALEAAEATLRLQQSAGFWRYPLPERKHLIATVEGNWAAMGLLASYTHEPSKEFLDGARRWYDYLTSTIGFQPHGSGKAINYFHQPRGKLPNNSVEALWVFLRLAQVTDEKRYTEHVDGLVEFLAKTQLPGGELPYIVAGPYERGRIHYLCYQYNAFQYLKLAWAAALDPDPRLRRILRALGGFLAKGVTPSGACRADCACIRPETDYFTAVLAAALHEASIADCRLPSESGMASVDRQPSALYRELSARCYDRLLARQRTDGSFAYTSGDYGFLRDSRSYPRPQAMTLFHLLYPIDDCRSAIEGCTGAR